MVREAYQTYLDRYASSSPEVGIYLWENHLA